MAEFTVTFNVGTSNREAYKAFIVSLRRRLGERSSHNRPALPVQEIPRPTRWFDILLQANDQSITLRIRMGNLYLDGYQIGNSGPWFEFGDSNPHLISGSTFLGLDSGYGGLASAAGQKMENIMLGQQQLVTAVNLLANATGTSQQQRARSLIIVIQMFCESIRFVPISDHLTSKFLLSSPILPWMLDLERSWGALSEALLLADAYPEQSFILPGNHLKIPPNREITTLADAADVLGILLGLCFRPNASERVLRMAVNDGGQGNYGRPLVEVFSVRINDIDGENPGNLHGTIIVTNGLHFEYLYYRTRENPESIKPGDDALLTGPARPISAKGSFTITLRLRDKDSKGEISCNTFNSTTNAYDVALSRDVDGRYVSVTVNYVVLSDAVVARVTVEYYGDGSAPRMPDVYGKLTAKNGDFGDSNKSVLFQRALDERVNVSPGQLIPLSRSVVAVPLNSILVVGANLYDHDGISSDDGEIANGTADFPARRDGASEKTIYGKNGHQIRVKVTWSVI